MFAAAHVMEPVAFSIESHFGDQAGKIEMTVPEDGASSGTQSRLKIRFALNRNIRHPSHWGELTTDLMERVGVVDCDTCDFF